ncbi:hypothetical protein AA309_30880 [Microvirga vignae]|uniref:Peptidase M10 serralysin C-terminal domain-containing protein n=1 Tax=Microvirga vignae TaxID=1225564 RepID=A0A0H1R324_9HYPH|nr:hypothetical protein [Microvirga vignae]KLK89518.1 hypothetical protein AA309_30880 [Microvirga vignae]
MLGSDKANKITANSGKNMLVGNEGNDTIDGDLGEDVFWTCSGSACEAQLFATFKEGTFISHKDLFIIQGLLQMLMAASPPAMFLSRLDFR